MDGLFKRIYLFGDATDEDIASVIKIATPRKYRQGELVFNEGDEADAMDASGIRVTRNPAEMGTLLKSVL